MDRGAWQATVTKSQTQLSDFHFHLQPSRLGLGPPAVICFSVCLSYLSSLAQGRIPLRAAHSQGTE